MMKIAVPSTAGRVDAHFGHCEEFLVFGVKDGSLFPESSIPSFESCGCKSGIAGVLAKAGVTHLVAGNMGEGALRVLGANGISVMRGASGDAQMAAKSFLEGSLKDSGQGCAEHHHGDAQGYGHDQHSGGHGCSR